MKRTSLALYLASTMALSAAGWTFGEDAALVAAPASPAPAAPATTDGPAPAPAAQAEVPAGDLLGVEFENQSAGISLRIPAGCHRIRSGGTGDDLAQFADATRNWQLKLNRIVRPQQTSLAPTNDNFGNPQPGLLDQTVERLKRDLPGCQILRSDLANVQDGDPNVHDNVGMIAVKYTAAAQHFVTQQAIIQGTPRLFYLIALTVPEKDERAAVETFRQMLDSVHLLDTTKIFQEQEQRLFHTRTLMTQWTAARLHKALIDEQWVRIIRDGKDIGYSYITEQTAAGVPRPLRLDELKRGMSDRDLVKPGDGILIGVRARSVDPAANIDPALKAKGPVQVDSASWLFSTPDRKLEDWSRVLVVDDHRVDDKGHPIKAQTEEFGSSNKTIVRALDRAVPTGTIVDPKDKKQPAVSIREQYQLDVTTVSQSGEGEPVDIPFLPPWYVPQALSHLLPRLVPLHPEMDDSGQLKKHSYMFAVYVPDVREVMHRYIDVRDEQQVTFEGRTMRAIPVDDRLGWAGSVTTHYMSPSGAYLGSENKQTHLVMLPTDAKTLLSLWKNADLTRPGGVERPHGNSQSVVPLGPSAPSAPADPGAQPSER